MKLCEIFKNTYFEEHLQTTAFKHYANIKYKQVTEDLKIRVRQLQIPSYYKVIEGD